MLLLNNNKERKAYWQALSERYSPAQIGEALKELPETTARVVRLHHTDGLLLKDIAHIIGKSVSVTRNHYTLGMYLLSQRFGKLD